MDINLQQYQYLLIVDLEATCCDQDSISRNEMETVEIGAVMLEAKALKVVDEFTIFIKPIRHPILTPFCTQLTSITQQDVDVALTYPEAIKVFKNWLYQYDNFLFCSWGDYDKRQLQRDSQFHQVALPIGAPHINIKQLFSVSQKLHKKYGMANALKTAELELQGSYHRGIDDAKNMAKLMPYVLGRKPLPCRNADEIVEAKYLSLG